MAVALEFQKIWDTWPEETEQVFHTTQFLLGVYERQKLRCEEVELMVRLYRAGHGLLKEYRAAMGKKETPAVYGVYNVALGVHWYLYTGKWDWGFYHTFLGATLIQVGLEGAMTRLMEVLV